MSCADGLCFLVYFVLLIIGELEGAVTYPPSNAVAEVNGEAVFNCSATPSGPTLWVLTRDGVISGEIRIASLCTLNAGQQSHYRVEQPGGPTTCNLIVFNITMEQAGVYHCTDTDTFRAALTVMDASPAVTYSNTLDVKEGENVVITCTLNYNGSVSLASTLRPHFYWTNYTGSNVSSFNDSTPVNSKAYSQLAVTAHRQDIMPYTCHVYMELIETGPAASNYANNTPSINSFASSQTISVQYYPNITRITSTVSTTDKCVYKQENLTCAADANPQAQYEWLDLSNNVKTIGSLLSISSGGQYQCIAHNFIRSVKYNDTKIASEATCYSPYNLTISGSNCPNNTCSCLGNQSSVSLSCTAGGFPVPTIQWRSDIPGLEYPKGNFTIEVDIDGNYSCTASNEYGGQPYMATASMLVTNCLPHPTTTPSTQSTRTVPRTTESSSPTIASTTTPEPNPVTGMTQKPNQFPPGAAAGIVIGCLIIVNVIAIGLFISYYGKAPESETNATSGSANSKSNKNRLNRRFPWLPKMLPCLNDTEQKAGSNIPWVLLFAFLGTITGVVTFPVWICLANKSEKTNERSSLTTRQNGGAEGESAANGMSPTNYPPPDYPPDSPPFKNRKGGQQQNDPYQNSSTVNIELANSRQFRNPDSPKLNTSPAWKPTPPDKKFVSGPAEKYVTTDPVITDAPGQSPLYADLPLKLNQIPLKPKQLLDDPENAYAPLNII